MYLNIVIKAPPPTSFSTTAAQEKIRSPYSPDLAPTDFLLFQSLTHKILNLKMVFQTFLVGENSRFLKTLNLNVTFL